MVVFIGEYRNGEKHGEGIEYNNGEKNLEGR